MNVRFKGCRIYDVKQRRCGVSNAPKIVRGAHRGHELRPALVGNFFCGAGEENFNETAVKLKNAVPTSHRRRAVSMACCDRPCCFLHHLCVGAALLHVYTLGGGIRVQQASLRAFVWRDEHDRRMLGSVNISAAIASKIDCDALSPPRRNYSDHLCTLAIHIHKMRRQQHGRKRHLFTDGMSQLFCRSLTECDQFRRSFADRAQRLGRSVPARHLSRHPGTLQAAKGSVAPGAPAVQYVSLRWL